MKVLFVHDGPMMSNPSKTVFYGVHYTDEIVQRYTYFGNEATFLMRNKIVMDNESLQFTKLTHPAFNFVEVPNFKSIRSKFRQKEAKSIIEKAVKVHDVVIVRLPSANGVIAKKIAEKYNKPVLVEVVACVFDALWNYDWRGKLLAHYKMRQYQNHIKHSTHVLYVTDHFLQKRYPTEGKFMGCSDVILQPIDKAIINRRIDKIQLISGNTLVIGTVAAIDVPYKGQADVIKVIALLKKQSVFIKYKIVGQGNPERLQNLIENLDVVDLVEIRGTLMRDKIFDFIDTIDLYIQPSKQEGLPRAVIEAMSRACPVMGSNIAGIPELISKDALFDAGDISAISRLLIKVDKEVLQRWAAENFKKVSEFTSSVLEEKRIKFYRQFKKDFNLG
jgi:glycosyltransferase involved in cell wall biosynthesis